MKKALWSIAAAAMLMFTLNACADTPVPVQTGNSPPPQATVESTPEPTRAAEPEQAVLSAGNIPLVEDSAAEDMENPVKLEFPAELSTTPAQQATPAPTTTPTPQVTPAPQETPAPAKGTIQFNVTTQKGDEESPAPSATPEPESTPTPPAQSEPPAESTSPAFSIDYWLSYAQNYARGAGLNLDPTATACWDNPIAAGAHCAYLERDIQSRLNRYARDESISDVWIWAEPRTDGSYDLYIGYA